MEPSVTSEPDEDAAVEAVFDSLLELISQEIALHGNHVVLEAMMRTLAGVAAACLRPGHSPDICRETGEMLAVLMKDAMAALESRRHKRPHPETTH